MLFDPKQESEAEIMDPVRGLWYKESSNSDTQAHLWEWTVGGAVSGEGNDLFLKHRVQIYNTTNTSSMSEHEVLLQVVFNSS